MLILSKKRMKPKNIVARLASGMARGGRRWRGWRSRGSVFFVLDVDSAMYALLATVVTVLMFAALSGALEAVGMPALTSPFVLVVWLLFVLAGPLFPRLHSAAG